MLTQDAKVIDEKIKVIDEKNDSLQQLKTVMDDLCLPIGDIEENTKNVATDVIRDINDIYQYILDIRDVTHKNLNIRDVTHKKLNEYNLYVAKIKGHKPQLKDLLTKDKKELVRYKNNLKRPILRIYKEVMERLREINSISDDERKYYDSYSIKNYILDLGDLLNKNQDSISKIESILRFRNEMQDALNRLVARIFNKGIENKGSIKYMYGDKIEKYIPNFEDLLKESEDTIHKYTSNLSLYIYYIYDYISKVIELQPGVYSNKIKPHELNFKDLLSQNQDCLDKYKNACEYYLNISHEFTGHEKAVPSLLEFLEMESKTFGRYKEVGKFYNKLKCLKGDRDILKDENGHYFIKYTENKNKEKNYVIESPIYESILTLDVLEKDMETLQQYNTNLDCIRFIYKYIMMLQKECALYAEYAEYKPLWRRCFEYSYFLYDKLVRPYIPSFDQLLKDNELICKSERYKNVCMFYTELTKLNRPKYETFHGDRWFVFPENLYPSGIYDNLIVNHLPDFRELFKSDISEDYNLVFGKIMLIYTCISQNEWNKNDTYLDTYKLMSYDDRWVDEISTQLPRISQLLSYPPKYLQEYENQLYTIVAMYLRVKYINKTEKYSGIITGQHLTYEELIKKDLSYIEEYTSNVCYIIKNIYQFIVDLIREDEFKEYVQDGKKCIPKTIVSQILKLEPGFLELLVDDYAINILRKSKFPESFIKKMEDESVPVAPIENNIKKRVSKFMPFMPSVHELSSKDRRHLELLHEFLKSKLYDIEFISEHIGNIKRITSRDKVISSKLMADELDFIYLLTQEREEDLEKYKCIIEKYVFPMCEGMVAIGEILREDKIKEEVMEYLPSLKDLLRKHGTLTAHYKCALDNYIKDIYRYTKIIKNTDKERLHKIKEFISNKKILDTIDSKYYIDLWSYLHKPTGMLEQHKKDLSEIVTYIDSPYIN